ncbi:putative ribosomal protein S18 [Plasmopara halstedii]
MVRAWLRPCASAVAVLGRRSKGSAKAALLSAQIPRYWTVCTDVSPQIGNVRLMVTKKKNDGKKEFKKKSTFDKVEFDEDPTELPEEVKYLSKELDEEKIGLPNELRWDEVEEDEDVEDAELSPSEWAKKFERDVAMWDQEEQGYDEDSMANVSPSNVEDDRLYVELPGYDASLSLAESQISGIETKNSSDPYKYWEQGMAYSPEMLNWMLPAEKRKPFKMGATKPWKYFVAANHADVVELALDVELLRLFISPTGRIRPRRYTGLTAKQQRRLTQAIKISRQLALLPYMSRYPEPTPEQWKAIDEEIIAAAELEADDDVGEDDDDDDFDEDFEYE